MLIENTSWHGCLVVGLVCGTRFNKKLLAKNSVVVTFPDVKNRGDKKREDASLTTAMHTIEHSREDPLGCKNREF